MRPRFFRLAQHASRHDLKKITITAVEGALIHNNDLTNITCYENHSITVMGELDTSDQEFSMPLKREDGRLVLFPVEVIDGKFEAVLNFPTSGQYIYTDEQANHDLPEQIFTIDPIRIDVLRKASN